MADVISSPNFRDVHRQDHHQENTRYADGFHTVIPGSPGLPAQPLPIYKASSHGRTDSVEDPSKQAIFSATLFPPPRDPEIMFATKHRFLTPTKEDIQEVIPTPQSEQLFSLPDDALSNPTKAVVHDKRPKPSRREGSGFGLSLGKFTRRGRPTESKEETATNVEKNVQTSISEHSTVVDSREHSPSKDGSFRLTLLPRRDNNGTRRGGLNGLFSRTSPASSETTLVSKPNSDAQGGEAVLMGEERDRLQDIPTGLNKRSSIFGGLTEHSKYKDELASAFRSLDNEHAKFLQKPPMLRMQMIRTVLLPFLKTNKARLSRALRTEDLEKRAITLDNWWKSLLELIDEKAGRSVAPSDRPALLEALLIVMSRPEWRRSFQTLNQSETLTLGRRSSTTGSVAESVASTSGVEEIRSRIQAMFVRNLTTQMDFVVFKMSGRNVPTSMVEFCGRATAFAFFFVPGVADTLVRLWQISPDNLKRASSGLRLQPRRTGTNTADEMTSFLPSHLSSLALTTVPALTRVLRRHTKPPPELAHLPWQGPWLQKWRGFDSELFYVFTRTAIAFYSDLLPEWAGPQERALAPGAILIQAQVLAMMDNTVNPRHGEEQVGISGSLIDSPLDSESVATMLPRKGLYGSRPMVQNRVVVLLRSCLDDNYPMPQSAKQALAVTIIDLITAVVKRVSMFNNDACVTLLDFLEETFNILSKFHGDKLDPLSFLDWPFWFDVLKKLSRTHNVFIEIRLYAFLYSMWSKLIASEDRKRAICLSWLLSRWSVQQRLCHWSPMVRAYFMRLLAWKILSCDSNPSELDLDIKRFARAAVFTTLGYHTYLCRMSEHKDKSPPTHEADNPAPGRALLIMRNDSVLPGHQELSLPSAQTVKGTQSPLLRAVPPGTQLRQVNEALEKWDKSQSQSPSPSSAPTPPSSKGLFSLFSRSKAKPPTLDTNVPRSGSISSVSGSMSSSVSSSPLAAYPQQSYTSHCFTFSLEWIPGSNPNNFTKHMHTHAQGQGQVMPLHAPRLPEPSNTQIQTQTQTQTPNLSTNATPSPAQTPTPTPTPAPNPSSSLPSEPPSDVATPSEPPNGPAPRLRALKPLGDDIPCAKYAGRAIAEWNAVVNQCDRFRKRRMEEGVPAWERLEVPTLGMEILKRLG